MDAVYKIKSKAEYIADLAFDIVQSDKNLGITDTALLNNILLDLNNIAETLLEYTEEEAKT